MKFYSESTVKDTVVTNDRWGQPAGCKRGDFLTCHDRYNPKTLQKHKWENCFTLDKHSLGLRREAQVADYLTIHDIITIIAETVRYSIEFHSYSYEILKQNAYNSVVMEMC
jgi:alpha-L-fucosidase